MRGSTLPRIFFATNINYRVFLTKLNLSKIHYEWMRKFR